MPPIYIEPTDLFRSDGKRSNGASIVPWKAGKVLVWDATCPDTLAPSYSTVAVREAGAVAADAEYRKSIRTSHPHIASFPLRWKLWGCSGKRRVISSGRSHNE